jgi:DNA-binding transcriptional regulator YiaG
MSESKKLPLLFGAAWENEKPRKREIKFPRVEFARKAPGQRVRDHGARRREAEWKAYQASWQTPINELKCDAGAFYTLRRHVLNLNRLQTARLLRVAVNSVLNWEHGTHPVPFPAFLALHMIAQSLQYHFADTAWRDWELRCHWDEVPGRRKVSGNAQYSTYLYNRRTGYSHTPEQLNQFWIVSQMAEAFKSTNRELCERIENLTSENQELRDLLLQAGVTDALHAMKQQLDALVAKANTARIVEMPRKLAATG